MHAKCVSVFEEKKNDYFSKLTRYQMHTKSHSNVQQYTDEIPNLLNNCHHPWSKPISVTWEAFDDSMTDNFSVIKMTDRS